MTNSVSNKLSNKYRYLQHASELGLVTPQTLLISESGDEHAIQDFVKSTGAKHFIVRSMNACEDGSEHSYAGHFWSSEAIIADEILSTIRIANENNQQALETLNLEASPQLMLQEYIEHSIGGVLFAPWSFFSDYYYVEYSTESVQEVVAGNSTPAVLSIDTKHTPPLLDDDLFFLKEKLTEMVNTLREECTFPIDCEWAYSKEKDAVVILQVRPQTHLVGAIQSAPPEVAKELSISSNWQFGALSESLGNLSPLSFSLLEQLYKDSLSTFQSIGYKAEAVDFLLRLPDGTVLVDPIREKAFYKSTLMGGFWKSFRAPQWQKKVHDFLDTLADFQSSSFSYQKLLTLFQLWMVANILSDGGGRENISLTHAYELSWYQALTVADVSSKPKDWNALNGLLRDLFFYELNKLKKTLSEEKYSVFCHWQEYLNKDFSKAQQRQHHDAPYAIYDFSNVNEDSSSHNNNQQSNAQSIGAKKVSTGPLFIIENPARFHQTIPAGSIILAPYFDNRWVHNIQHLKRIITHKGSQLSHSAIVAREYGVPFCVVSDEAVQGLKQGDLVVLDSVQLDIVKSIM
ncbi:MAG: hypothetical protein L3J51_01560 [Cocleimonas sp.]|nr:hypothetical protein [Cocleimonas sp.]